MKADLHSVSLHNLIIASPARRKSLTGEWNGFVWPKQVPNAPDQIPIHFKFNDDQGKVVVGEMSFTSFDKNRGVIENQFIGGFASETELWFLYMKKLDGVIG